LFATPGTVLDAEPVKGTASAAPKPTHTHDNPERRPQDVDEGYPPFISVTDKN
jgi:hypothetical protein